MSEKRSSFTGKLGFVLAAAGSAVGLGNIWRFPYLAGQYGGGIFLLVYLLLALTLGFALMCAEIAIGRKTGKSAIHAFGELDKRFSFIGWLGSIVPMLILPYYCVIGGWVAKYLYVFVSGQGAASAGENYFSNFTELPFQPIGWFLLFLGLTAVVVLLGVEKGIEKISKVMMPVLFALVLFLAVYVMLMPGAMEGVKFYLLPDFSKFSADTVLAAMGQLFYSMSIAMGIMITYGSYMKKDVSIESSVHQIEICDTSVAFLSGLMVIPAIFSTYAGDSALITETLEKSGPGLMFAALPKVFLSMPGGAIIGVVFFLLVLFAALTSSISLMETVVSIVKDKLGWSRRNVCIIVIVGTLLLGLPSAMGYGLLSGVQLLGKSFLDFFDYISNNLLMPVVALLTSLFVGWIIKPRTLADEIKIGGKFHLEWLFVGIIKYVAPICIVLILLTGLGVI